VWLSVKSLGANARSVVLEGLLAENLIRLSGPIGEKLKGVKGLGKGERRGNANA